MIEKINLLKEKGENEGENSFFDIIINRCEEGKYILYEREYMLPPNENTPSQKSDGEKDTIYFISGNGNIHVDTLVEPVEKGDQVMILSNMDYVVSNTGEEPLHFTITGIGSLSE